MTYEEAVGFYHSLQRFGINPGLERAQLLCKKLGSPQNNLKFVHVAGTNGKGTTCTEIASVLTASGYVTGLYTSPYVIDFRERIQLCEKLISKEDLVKITLKVSNAVNELNSVGVYPTEFEAVTAAAFLYFYECKCDIVVLEVGLGGRYDATNIIKNPLCSVIVSVSLDHVNILGNTITEIAGEKCGIIKSNTKVFTNKNQHPDAMSVIKSTCNKMNCKLIVTNEDSMFTVQNSGLCGTDVQYNGKYMLIPFCGKHQLENASTAVSVCKSLCADGYNKITDDSIIKGIESSFIPARTEVLCKNPLVLLDGSHNDGSTFALRQVLMQNLGGKRVLAVMGMMKDKDCSAALKNLLPCFAEIIAVTPSNPRAMSASDFCKIVQSFGVICAVEDNPCKGVDLAFEKLKNFDALCVCGSLYLSADVRTHIIDKCGNSAGNKTIN